MILIIKTVLVDYKMLLITFGERILYAKLSSTRKAVHTYSNMPTTLLIGMPGMTKLWLLLKEKNKLILVSIGYSACHWCHVMEHESFEDEQVAAIMNENFINIKVDREERPDIDMVYISVQLMTGQGGWPLVLFFTLPDGRPIYGGTYFPKAQWINILSNLADLFATNPDKAYEYTAHLTDGLEQLEIPKAVLKMSLK